LDDLIKAKNESKEKSFVELRSEELKAVSEFLELPKRGSLYYPACGDDESPSLAFSEWDVTYLDAVDDSLDKAGRRFFKGNLLNPPFEEDEVFDVVLIISPGIQFQDKGFYGYINKATENLREGGYVICDNKHDTASLLEEKDDSFEKVDKPDSVKEFYVFEKKKPEDL